RAVEDRDGLAAGPAVGALLEGQLDAVGRDPGDPHGGGSYPRLRFPRLSAAKSILLAALSLTTLVFVAAWLRAAIRGAGHPRPTGLLTAIGFVTNFFDTLGIGSFAPTTSVFKLKRLVPDELIPGTLNVGHALPTIVEAFIFIAIVEVEPITLASMIAASVAGAWLGAGAVAGWPRR